ncbi:hypothetical protein PIROE2DRAFT_57873 [Piromyces sp. E2]|nr:hypothetical protein PIROE2DRAFT_57873 [Piromyces sp. E2]|eukprot:OUM68788.1 hypothetical protein PIROE2DRAFT_57873 [Piromyces sp. E2]
MEREKKKRPNEDSPQDSFSESINKKRKITEKYNIIKEKFKCKSFYIDKSLLIKEFMEDDSDIICVTRPSNYGKTTNLIMLREFFQMNYEKKENSENRKFII